MKKLLALLMVSVLGLNLLSGCGSKTANTTTQAAETTAAETAAETEGQTSAAPESVAKEAIKIVYTNDIHSYAYNTITDKETKETHPGLRISSAAAMKKDLLANGENVLLVDAGDEIQGNIYGSCNDGETIIDIMNLAEYDLACPGNHEFDYGISVFFDRVAQAKYPFISCTFKNLPDKTTVLEPYKIYDYNGTKVAIVGVSTPFTYTSVARTTFMDENKNQIYTFSGLKDVNEFYNDVQATIDDVKDQVDYVIGLGHVGLDAGAQVLGLSSRDLINHTQGFDAFIDGHSHTVLASENVKDKEGEDVLLTQTGTGLANIGVMTITSEGQISTELVTEYPNYDTKTAELEDAFEAIIQEKTTVKIGELDTTLCTHDPDHPDVRLVRTSETNLGDFITDAYYWYINEVVDSSCDVVINNGGGLRAPIEKGDVRYIDIKNVVPFSNALCMIKVTGAQLKDIFENGSALVGGWDPEINAPAELGAFMHAAGVRYTIDASVPSSIEYADEAFKQVTGEYRVKDLQIYNKETCEYEDVDPERSYTLGGIDYLLRKGGSGLSFLQDNECVISYVGPEVELVIEYINAFEKNGEYSEITSSNSPLAQYKNYMINYKEPYGAGRINIINLNYQK